jgi:hypothetical protein
MNMLSKPLLELVWRVLRVYPPRPYVLASPTFRAERMLRELSGGTAALQFEGI